MPRSIRIQCPGALYHVMARGNRREAIYRDDDDRRFFLKTLAEGCDRLARPSQQILRIGNRGKTLPKVLKTWANLS